MVEEVFSEETVTREEVEGRLDEALFKPPTKSVDFSLVMKRDMRKLFAAFNCSAQEEEEEWCAGFAMGSSGRCQFVGMSSGLKTCLRMN